MSYPPPEPTDRRTAVPTDAFVKLGLGFRDATHPDDLIAVLADFFDDPKVDAALQSAQLGTWPMIRTSSGITIEFPKASLAPPITVSDWEQEIRDRGRSGDV